MENQTRFDLNTAIESWRRELASQKGLSAEVRSEFETRMNEAVSEFQRLGYSGQESFWFARRRVQPQQFYAEYASADLAKVWGERVIWMASAVIAFRLWEEVFSNIFSYTASVIAPRVDPHWAGVAINGLGTGVYYLARLIGFLFFLLFAVKLSRGQVGDIVLRLKFPFSSPTSFVVVAISMVLAAYACRIAVLVYNLPILSFNLFLFINLPFLLIGLVAWLISTCGNTKVQNPSGLPEMVKVRTSFDLNEAMGNWRRGLVAESNIAAENRFELEAHLSDIMAGLKSKGASDEEVFSFARWRVGQPKQLAEEFIKANPEKIWRERTFWMLLAIFVVQMWSQVWPFLCGCLSTIIFKILAFVDSGIGEINYNNGLVEMVATCTVFLLGSLCVFWLAVCIASGRTKLFEPLFQLIRRSRWHAGLGCVALVLVSSSLQLSVEWHYLTTPGPQSVFSRMFVYKDIVNATLTILLVLTFIRLMPPSWERSSTLAG